MASGRQVLVGLCFAALWACSSADTDNGSGSGNRPVAGLELVDAIEVEAGSCAELSSKLNPDDPERDTIDIGTGGNRSSCTVDVSATNPILADAGIENLGCPAAASILLPFDRVGGLWVLDVDELSVIDNGACFEAQS